MFDEVHLMRLASHNPLGGESLTYLCNPRAVCSAGRETQPAVRPHRYPQ